MGNLYVIYKHMKRIKNDSNIYIYIRPQTTIVRNHKQLIIHVPLPWLEVMIKKAKYVQFLMLLRPTDHASNLPPKQ